MKKTNKVLVTLMVFTMLLVAVPSWADGKEIIIDGTSETQTEYSNTPWVGMDGKKITTAVDEVYSIKTKDVYGTGYTEADVYGIQYTGSSLLTINSLTGGIEIGAGANRSAYGIYATGKTTVQSLSSIITRNREEGGKTYGIVTEGDGTFATNVTFMGGKGSISAESNYGSSYGIVTKGAGTTTVEGLYSISARTGKGEEAYGIKAGDIKESVATGPSKTVVSGLVDLVAEGLNAYGIYTYGSYDTFDADITFLNAKGYINATGNGGKAYGIKSDGIDGSNVATTVKELGSITATASEEAYGIYANVGEGSKTEVSFAESGGSIVAKNASTTSSGIVAEGSGTVTVANINNINAIGNTESVVKETRGIFINGQSDNFNATFTFTGDDPSILVGFDAQTGEQAYSINAYGIKVGEYTESSQTSLGTTRVYGLGNLDVYANEQAYGIYTYGSDENFMADITFEGEKTSIYAHSFKLNAYGIKIGEENSDINHAGTTTISGLGSLNAYANGQAIGIYTRVDKDSSTQVTFSESGGYIWSRSEASAAYGIEAEGTGTAIFTNLGHISANADNGETRGIYVNGLDSGSSDELLNTIFTFAENRGSIEVSSTSGNAYGIYANSTGQTTIGNLNSITAQTTSNWSYAYGIYTDGGLSSANTKITFAEGGTITSTSYNEYYTDEGQLVKEGGYAYGIRKGGTENTTIEGLSSITAKALYQVYGILTESWGDNSKAEISFAGEGSITAEATYDYAYGIRAGGSSAIIKNLSSITALGNDGTAYGIYSSLWYESSNAEITFTEGGTINSSSYYEYTTEEGETVRGGGTAYGIRAEGTGVTTVKNLTSVTAKGYNGEAVGIFYTESYANTSNMEITFTGAGNITAESAYSLAYGIKAESVGTATVTNLGSIEANGYGDTYGVYINAGEGKDEETKLNTTVTFTDAGNISATSTDGTAYGIYENSTGSTGIDNINNLTVKSKNGAYGIYTASSDENASTSITFTGTDSNVNVAGGSESYFIYSQSNSSAAIITGATGRTKVTFNKANGNVYAIGLKAGKDGQNPSSSKAPYLTLKNMDITTLPTDTTNYAISATGASEVSGQSEVNLINTMLKGNVKLAYGGEFTYYIEETGEKEEVKYDDANVKVTLDENSTWYLNSVTREGDLETSNLSIDTAGTIDTRARKLGETTEAQDIGLGGGTFVATSTTVSGDTVFPKISFDLSISGNTELSTDTDTIMASTITGEIQLGDIDIIDSSTAILPDPVEKYATLFDGTTTNTITITGTRNIISSKQRSYRIEGDSDHIGKVKITVAATSYTLPQVIVAEGGAEGAGSFEEFQLAADLNLTAGLGTLVNKSGETTYRDSFTINGKGNSLILADSVADGKVTINSGDTMNIKDLTINNFKTFATNSGTLNLEDVRFEKSKEPDANIVNDNTLNVSGTTVFDRGITHTDGKGTTSTTTITSGTTTVTGNIEQDQLKIEAGAHLDYNKDNGAITASITNDGVLNVYSSTTIAGDIVGTATGTGAINIKSGKVTALSITQDALNIENGAALEFTGGSITSSATNDGTLNVAGTTTFSEGITGTGTTTVKADANITFKSGITQQIFEVSSSNTSPTGTTQVTFNGTDRSITATGTGETVIGLKATGSGTATVGTTDYALTSITSDNNSSETTYKAYGIYASGEDSNFTTTVSFNGAESSIAATSKAGEAYGIKADGQGSMTLSNLGSITATTSSEAGGAWGIATEGTITGLNTKVTFASDGGSIRVDGANTDDGSVYAIHVEGKGTTEVANLNEITSYAMCNAYGIYSGGSATTNVTFTGAGSKVNLAGWTSTYFVSANEESTTTITGVYDTAKGYGRTKVLFSATDEEGYITEGINISAINLNADTTTKAPSVTLTNVDITDTPLNYGGSYAISATGVQYSVQSKVELKNTILKGNVNLVGHYDETTQSYIKNYANVGVTLDSNSVWYLNRVIRNEEDESQLSIITTGTIDTRVYQMEYSTYAEDIDLKGTFTANSGSKISFDLEIYDDEGAIKIDSDTINATSIYAGTINLADIDISDDTTLTTTAGQSATVKLFYGDTVDSNFEITGSRNIISSKKRGYTITGKGKGTGELSITVANVDFTLPDVIQASGGSTGAGIYDEFKFEDDVYLTGGLGTLDNQYRNATGLTLTGKRNTLFASGQAGVTISSAAYDKLIVKNLTISGFDTFATNSGTLYLEDVTFENTGTTDVSNAGTLNVSGTTTFSKGITGTGTTNISAGADVIVSGGIEQRALVLETGSETTYVTFTGNDRHIKATGTSSDAAYGVCVGTNTVASLGDTAVTVLNKITAINENAKEAYGIYTNVGEDRTSQVTFSGSNSSITATNTSNSYAYGIYTKGVGTTNISFASEGGSIEAKDEQSAANVYGIYTNGTGTTTITNLNGITAATKSGFAYGIYATGTGDDFLTDVSFTNSGSIEATSTNSDAYGIKIGEYIENAATGKGTTGVSDLKNITVGGKNAYGIATYGADEKFSADITFTSNYWDTSIEVEGAQSGNVYGIYAQGTGTTTVTNLGEITARGMGGWTYGIYTNGADDNFSAAVSLNDYGGDIKALSTSSTGDAYGIYAEKRGTTQITNLEDLTVASGTTSGSAYAIYTHGTDSEFKTDIKFSNWGEVEVAGLTKTYFISSQGQGATIVTGANTEEGYDRTKVTFTVWEEQVPQAAKEISVIDLNADTSDGAPSPSVTLSNFDITDDALNLDKTDNYAITASGVSGSAESTLTLKNTLLKGNVRLANENTKVKVTLDEDSIWYLNNVERGVENKGNLSIDTSGTIDTRASQMGGETKAATIDLGGGTFTATPTTSEETGETIYPKISFDAEFYLDGETLKIKCDTINASTVTGTIALGNVALLGSDNESKWGQGETRELVLFDGICTGLTITGTVTASTQHYDYTITSKAGGVLTVSQGSPHKYTLPEYVQGTYTDTRTKEVYTLEANETLTSSLGTLVNKSGETIYRNSFTIKSKENEQYTLLAGDNEGVTIKNADDKMFVENLTISGFGTFAQNSGILTLTNVIFTESQGYNVSNYGTLNICGETTFDNSISGYDGTTKVMEGANVTVEGDINQEKLTIAENASLEFKGYSIDASIENDGELIVTSENEAYIEKSITGSGKTSITGTGKIMAYGGIEQLSLTIGDNSGLIYYGSDITASIVNSGTLYLGKKNSTTSQITGNITDAGQTDSKGEVIIGNGIEATISGNITQATVRVEEGASLEYGDGNTISANVENSGTLTIKENATIADQYVNAGVLNLSDDAHEVGTVLNVDVFAGKSGRVNFDADIRDDKEDTDYILVNDNAYGTVTIGSFNIKSGDKLALGATKTLMLFRSKNDKGEWTSNFPGLEITISGGGEAATSDGYKYEFAWAGAGNEGSLIGTKKLSYEFWRIVQNEPTEERPGEEPGKISTFSLVSNYDEDYDLGTLGRVTGSNIRELTINGNNYTFTSSNKAGITVNKGDSLTLQDIASFGGFKGDAVTNSGTLTVTNSTVTSSITNKGTVYVSGTTTLGNGLVGTGSMTIKSGANLTVSGGITQQALAIASGSVATKLSFTGDKRAVNITNTSDRAYGLKTSGTGTISVDGLGSITAKATYDDKSAYGIATQGSGSDFNTAVAFYGATGSITATSESGSAYGIGIGVDTSSAGTTIITGLASITAEANSDNWESYGIYTNGADANFKTDITFSAVESIIKATNTDGGACGVEACGSGSTSISGLGSLVVSANGSSTGISASDSSKVTANIKNIKVTGSSEQTSGVATYNNGEVTISGLNNLEVTSSSAYAIAAMGKKTNVTFDGADSEVKVTGSQLMAFVFSMSDGSGANDVSATIEGADPTKGYDRTKVTFGEDTPSFLMALGLISEVSNQTFTLKNIDISGDNRLLTDGNCAVIAAIGGDGSIATVNLENTILTGNAVLKDVIGFGYQAANLTVTLDENSVWQLNNVARDDASAEKLSIDTSGTIDTRGITTGHKDIDLGGGTFTASEGAKLSFDAEISDAGVTTDTITASSASGTIALGSINVSATEKLAWAEAKTAYVFKVTGAENADPQITITGTTVTVGQYNKYTFKGLEKGQIEVTITGGYTLPQTIQARLEESGEVATYSINSNLSIEEDGLGVLNNDNRESFTIYGSGSGSVLDLTNKTGITLEKADDVLHVKNLTVSNSSTFATNAGTLNLETVKFTGSTGTANVVNNNILNVSGTTEFDKGITGTGTTNIAGGTATVEGEINQSALVISSGACLEYHAASIKAAVANSGTFNLNSGIDEFTSNIVNSGTLNVKAATTFKTDILGGGTTTIGEDGQAIEAEVHGSIAQDTLNIVTGNTLKYNGSSITANINNGGIFVLNKAAAITGNITGDSGNMTIGDGTTALVTVSGNITQSSLTIANGATLEYGNGGTISATTTNNGTLTIKDTATVTTLTNNDTGVINLSDDTHEVGTQLYVGTFSSDLTGGSLNFDAEVDGSQVNTDCITVQNAPIATTSINLGTLHIHVTNPATGTIEIELFKASDPEIENFFEKLTINGKVISTVTSDGHSYQFSQSDETGEKGKLKGTVTKDEAKNTLKAVVQASDDRGTVTEFSLVGDGYHEANDLDNLKRIGGKPRDLTIAGNNHTFESDGHNGITVDNPEDKLTLQDLASFSGFNGDAVTNKGILTVSNSNVGSGITNNKTMNLVGSTTFTSNIKGAEGTTNVNSGTATFSGDIQQSEIIIAKDTTLAYNKDNGTIDAKVTNHGTLALSKAATITKDLILNESDVKVEEGTLNVEGLTKVIENTTNTIEGTVSGAKLVNDGTLTANASDLQFGAIENNSMHTLILTGGDIAADITAAENETGSVVIDGNVKAFGTNFTDQYITVNEGKELRFGSGTTTITRGRLSAQNATLGFCLDGFANGDTIVDATGASEAVDMTGTNVALYQNKETTLQKGDKINLISGAAGDYATRDIEALKEGEGIKAYTYNTYLSDSKLVAELKDGGGKKAIDESKSLSEGFIAGSVALMQANDLSSTSAIESAKTATETSAGDSVVPYATIQGGHGRYHTGSHVDLNSTQIAAGVAQKFGESTIGGLLIEGGEGRYTSYNEFTSGELRADGEVKYYGIGLFARHAFSKSNIGNAYVDAAFGVGRTDQDYRTNDIAGIKDYHYDVGVIYLKAHATAGYEWHLGKSSLDGYVKYLWACQNGATINFNGQDVNFDTINSHRVRVGARYTQKIQEALAWYAGLAFEYEFDASAGANSNGLAIAEPDLRGGSGMAEIGLKYMPGMAKAWMFDLGLEGFMGKRDSLSVKLAIWYMFNNKK